MKSNNVNDHGMPDQSIGKVKKPWVTPSLEIISLESAEGGKGGSHRDSHGIGSASSPYS